MGLYNRFFKRFFAETEFSPDCAVRFTGAPVIQCHVMPCGCSYCAAACFRTLGLFSVVMNVVAKMDKMDVKLSEI